MDLKGNEKTLLSLEASALHSIKVATVPSSLLLWHGHLLHQPSPNGTAASSADRWMDGQRSGGINRLQGQADVHQSRLYNLPFL